MSIKMKPRQGGVSAQDLAREAVLAHQRGNLSKAEKLYRAILQAQPDNFAAMHLLATLLHQRGKSELPLACSTHPVPDSHRGGVFAHAGGVETRGAAQGFCGRSYSRLSKHTPDRVTLPGPPRATKKPRREAGAFRDRSAEPIRSRAGRGCGRRRCPGSS